MPPKAVPDINLPERYKEILHGLVGVDKLVGFVHVVEGERIGREGGDLASILAGISAQLNDLSEKVNDINEQLIPMRNGMVALLEGTRAKDTNVVAFNPRVAEVDNGAGPGGISADDCARVAEYCKELAGGNKNLFNAGYARVMQDAEARKDGTLASRWMNLAEDAITKAREGRMGGGQFAGEEFHGEEDLSEGLFESE